MVNSNGPKPSSGKKVADSAIPQHKRMAMNESPDTGGSNAKGPKTRP